ncbi:MAG: ACP S-malonyltransferase [Chromatiales bacterium]
MSEKFAVVFPGQGSQSVGMLSDLYDNHALVADTFKEASDALGFDLWDMVKNGPVEQLNQTFNTQPAMLAAGIAVWRVMQQAGMAQPALLAGHSLGEYSALVASGALDYSDAIKLVAERGRLMQDAVPQGEGAMAAILGLDDDQVRDICEQAAQGQVAEAVNFNSPGQVVIAGNSTAIERAMELAKQAGAKRALPLPVSAPSHCALMKPAAEKLAHSLAAIQWSTPQIPVIHNVNVASVANTEIASLLEQQLYSPVRWVETVQHMHQNGIDLLIEAGPGKVLTGLCKRIDKAVNGMAVFDDASLQAAMEKIHA